MTFFTGKGDDGKTCAFDCDQRFSKSSNIANALGDLDEANSYLGVIKSFLEEEDDQDFKKDIIEIQQNLFIIQAEVSGAENKIDKTKISQIEERINQIEKEIPPIKNFIISGGTKLSSRFDFSRTLVRRAERTVVASREEGKVNISSVTMIYLNRLSSLLYALARLSDYLSGIKEQSPTYK